MPHIFTEHIVISVINVPTTAQVAIEKGIDWSKYDKWNEVANESIKAEMELEEERTDREEKVPRERKKKLGQENQGIRERGEEP